MGKNFIFETTREPYDEKYQVKTGESLSFTSSFIPSIWEFRKGESRPEFLGSTLRRR